MNVQRAGIIALFASALAFAVFWGWSDTLFDLGGDSSAYLLVAKAYSPFVANTAELASFKAQNTYPPLFFLVVALFGATAFAGNLLVAIALWAASVAFYFWLVEEEFHPWIAAVSAILFLLFPLSYLSTLNLLTENFYLFFSLAAIAAVAKAERPDTTECVRWYTIAALLVSAAVLTRVAALPLLLAFLAQLLLRRPRRAVLLAALALVPFLVWMVWAKFSQVGIDSYTQQWVNKYPDNVLGYFVRTALRECVALVVAWHDGLAGFGAGGIIGWMALAIGALGLGGAVMRLRTLRFDAVYFAIYLLMILAWPHPEEAARYGFPLFPLVFAYALDSLRRIGRIVPGRLANELLPAIGLLVVAGTITPPLFLNVTRYRAPVAPDIAHSNRIDLWYSDDRLNAEVQSRFTHRLLNHIDGISQHVPKGECIFTIKPAVVALRTRREAFGPPKSSASDAEFDRQIARCRYGYAIWLRSPTYNAMLYPLARLPNRARVISAVRFADDPESQIIGLLYEILPGPKATAE